MATSGRFHDLWFEAVQRDPMAEVTRLYAELGDELTDEARGRMQVWWATSAGERSGPHRYRPETYGLDLAAVGDQFAFYYERFDIPVEDRTIGGTP